MGAYKWIGTALLEFLINMIVSLLPFIVAIITLMLSAKANASLHQAAMQITKNGELVVYSATLMAPIIYAVLRDPPVRFRAAFAILGGIPVLLGVIVYVIAFTDSFTDRLLTTSAFSFAIGIAVFLTLLLIEHKVKFGQSAPQLQIDIRNNSLEAYKRHRGA